MVGEPMQRGGVVLGFIIPGAGHLTLEGSGLDGLGFGQWPFWVFFIIPHA